MGDSIPPPVLLVIGAAVAIVSIGVTISGSNLTLFAIVGCVIFIYGMVKLFLGKKAEPAKKAASAKQHQTLQHCHNCGVPIHPKQNFCAHCGARLK